MRVLGIAELMNVSAHWHFQSFLEIRAFEIIALSEYMLWACHQ